MRNEMYINLLGQIKLLPGYLKTENIKALEQTVQKLAFYINENKNSSNEVLENTKGEAALLFQKFKDDSSYVLNAGRDGLNQEIQNIYSSLMALQKPTDCYIKNLEEGKTLDVAFKDSSWIEGLFNEVEPAKDRDDYVPAQYSTEGKSVKQILDSYKADRDEAQRRYFDYKSKLSGDSINPDYMIQYKLSLLQDYIDSNATESKKADFKIMLGNGFKEMNERYKTGNVTDLSSRAQMMDKAFFGEKAEVLQDRTFLVGNLEKMKSLSPEAVKRLKDESKKLRFNSSKMGVTSELSEKFMKNAVPLMAPVLNAKSVLDNVDIPDERKIAEKIISSFYNTVEKAQDYINEHSDIAPSDEEYLNVAKDSYGILKEFAPYNKAGELGNLYSGFYNLFDALCSHVPCVGAVYADKHKEVADDLKTQYLKQQDKLSDPGLTEEEKRTHRRGLKDVLEYNMFPREFFNDARMIRMARDPQFCQEVIDDCIETLATYVEKKDIAPGSSQSRFFHDSSAFTSKTISPEEMYDEVFSHLIMGKRIQAERQKLEALNAGGVSELDKLKSGGDTNLSKIITAKSPDSETLDSIRNEMNSLKESDAYKEVIKSEIEAMSSIAHNPDTLTHIVESVAKPEHNFLEGINDNTLSALVQTSGIAFWPNSSSYKKMSNALKDIYKKNNEAGGATKEDYLKLYEACKDYALSHDGDPSTSNGKLRANAAVNVMHTLGTNLSKLDPEFAKTFEKDKAVNMVRNKDYRDAVTRGASSKVKNLAARYKNQIQNDYVNLPKDVKENLESQIRLLGISKSISQELKELPENALTDKIKDSEGMEMVETVVNHAEAFSKSYLETYIGNPVKASEAASQEIKNDAAIHAH